VRVLLVSPNTERINIPVLPLGLAQVAAASEQAGHTVSLLNLMWEEDTPHSLARAIDSARPDVIGISVRNIDDQNMQEPRFLLDPVRDVVRGCRQRCPGVPIVLGGAGYSIFPDAALAYLDADVGIRGEGEATFPELVARFDRGEDIRGLPAVHVPVGKGLELRARSLGSMSDAAGNQVSTTDLDRAPSPDPARWLAEVPRDCWVPVQTRRGCPLDCSYCSTASIEGRQVRRKSPDRAARELSAARGLGFRRFYFVDNTFNLPEVFALRLCDEIARRDLDIEWRCIMYPRRVSATLAEAMRRAGCVEASIGFESGSEPILKSLNKRFTLDDVRTTCARLAAVGIRRNGFLLLGAPGETNASIDESLAFAGSLRLDSLNVRLGIRIYPGTLLHATAIGEGVVSPDDDLLLPRFYMARGVDASRIRTGLAS
jgi:radical SAM superfamily enzyme YgiQ (UPF0313 family)